MADYGADDERSMREGRGIGKSGSRRRRKSAWWARRGVADRELREDEIDRRSTPRNDRIDRRERRR